MSRLFIVALPIVIVAVLFGPELRALIATVLPAFDINRNSLASEKPPLIIGAYPHWSHVEKLLEITDGLVKKGYPVHFMSGPVFKKQIEAVGAVYEEIEGMPTTPGAPLVDDLMVELAKMDPNAPETTVFLWSQMFHWSIPRSFRTLQRLMKRIDDARTMYIHDTTMLAAAPLFRGTAGLRPHTTIALSVAGVCIDSNDTMPYNSGKVPQTGPDAREVHWQAQLEFDKHPIYAGLNVIVAEIFSGMNASVIPSRATDTMAMSDILCPLTIPDFEFTRTDVKRPIVFIGMPKKPGVQDRQMPPWWNQVLQAKRDGKKIIVVSRSSFDQNIENSMLPALEGLKDRTDAAVVAALVTMEVEDFRANYDVPANTYLAKWIPMDMLLPHADVLFTSAGYGTIQNALRHGVPFVMHGELEDKPHTAALTQHFGVGIAHQRTKIDPQTVSESVDQILTDPSYRQKIQKMKEVYQDYDPVERLDSLLQERMKIFEEL